MATATHSLPLVLLFLSACMTTKEHSSPLPPAAAVSLAPAQAWELVSPETGPVGYLVRFEESAPSSAAPRCFFSVRNTWQQELGLVDDLGRSWRFEPHAQAPNWLGSGSIAEGTSRILGLEVQLAEIDLARLTPASTPKN